MKLSDNVYNILKNWVIPILTDGATLILTVGELWHFPSDTVKAVAGTMTALFCKSCIFLLTYGG